MEGEEKKAFKITDPETVKTILKLFILHLQNRSQQQHTELVNTFKSFCFAFPDTKDHLKMAERLKTEPIKYFMEVKPKYFSKAEKRNIDKDYRLPELDFIYYRDTSFAKKLITEYKTSSRAKRRRYQKKLNLPQILSVLSWVREVLFKNLVAIANENGFQVPMILPPVPQQNNEGVGIGK